MQLKALLLTGPIFFSGITGNAANAAEKPVELVLQDHVYRPSELRLPAGEPVVILLKNLDSTSEEFESEVLRVAQEVAANGEALINLKPMAPGRYPFIGEDHEATAKGVLIVE